MQQDTKSALLIAVCKRTLSRASPAFRAELCDKNLSSTQKDHLN